MEAIFNAGFYSQYLHSIKQNIQKFAGFDIEFQARRLSSFALESFQFAGSDKSAGDLERKISAVYTNLICRGLPTFPSMLVERSIIETIHDHVPVIEEILFGSLTTNCRELSRRTEAEWYTALTRSHIPIDPRLESDDYSLRDCDSTAEDFFRRVFLAGHISRFLPLITEVQRPFETLVPVSVSAEFINQRVDFAVEFGAKKLVFEIDGSQHTTDIRQNSLDRRRDQALKDAGWDVFRIPAYQVGNEQSWMDLERVKQIIKSEPAAAMIEQSFENPLWDSSFGQCALTAVLAPYGVARIQRSLLLALQSGILLLDAPTWRIAVLERDVRCAELAIVDFLQHLNAFLDLIGEKRSIPPVELIAFYSTEFSESPLILPFYDATRFQLSVVEKPISDFDQSSTPGDVFIDLSMLAYQGYYRPDNEYYSQHLKTQGTVYVIRNTHSFQETRQLQSIEPIAYVTDNQNCQSAIRFFLQNIFRKNDFRDGQLDIINRALSLKPVIGLLPTGAGKSLCYQLAGLLQPGLTLVIDPLISLMIDQQDNLTANYAIDWVSSISSNKTPAERKEVLQRMTRGELLFVLISPERFQNREFRQKLIEVTNSFSISYGVIDEAHCVSEWGHDFRTSYLKLAETIRQFCLYHGKYRPIIIALTGTASYAVLSDVQREIGVEEEAAKVYPKTFDRKELSFDIVNVETKSKLEALRTILRNMPNHFNIPGEMFFQPNGSQTYAGIIFTPHVNGEFGVYQVYQNLVQELHGPVRYFSGEVPNITVKTNGGSSIKNPVMTPKAFQEYKTEVQRDFKANKFNVLVATKAFGMGIDKSNIRYVIHYNIPHSLEAYYQEAGRAGRDKRPARCIIIYSDDKPEDADTALAFNSSDVDLDRIAKSFGGGDIHRLLFLHRNAFKGRREEVLQTSEILKIFIYPNFQVNDSGKPCNISVPFGSDAETMAREKVIYRLAIIGLVQDYTVNYDNRQFEVTLLHRQEQEYIQSLQNYIQRYRTREVSESLPGQVKGRLGNNIIEKCLGYLLDFVYEEIEKKRRAAIRSIAEISRKASKFASSTEKDQFIRQELLAYLEHSPFTEDLLKLARQVDPGEWVKDPP